MIVLFWVWAVSAALTLLYGTIQAFARTARDDESYEAFLLYPLTVVAHVFFKTLGNLKNAWTYFLFGPVGFILLVQRDMMAARIELLRSEMADDTIDYVDAAIEDLTDPDHPDRPVVLRELN